MQKINIYAHAWKQLAIWTLISSAAHTGLAFLAGFIFGMTGNEDLFYGGLILAGVVQFGLLVFGCVKYAQAYPGLNPGFWPKFWAAFLGMFRVGYDRPGLKNLPWKTLATWTLASAIISPRMIDLVLTAPEATSIGAIILTPIMMVIFILIAYGVGYYFGGFKEPQLMKEVL